MLPSQSLCKSYSIEASEGKGSAKAAKAAVKAAGAAVKASMQATVGDAAAYKTATFRSSHTVRTFDGYQAAFLMNDSGEYSPEERAETKDLAVGQPLWLAGDDSLAEVLSKASSTGLEDGQGQREGQGEDEEEDEEGEDDKGENAHKGGDGTKDKWGDTALRVEGLSGISHVTRAPSRFTEASFIKELELIGVGRPSTYSKVFQILRDRGYVLVDKQTLIPTITGMVVSGWLERHFPDLVEAKFTALMESSLDQIARGQKDKLGFLSAFYLGDGTGEGVGEKASGEGSAVGSGVGTGLGLLPAVERKLSTAQIDHKESRTLVVPFLSELGVLQLGRSGAFIESHSNATGTILKVCHFMLILACR